MSWDAGGTARMRRPLSSRRRRPGSSPRARPRRFDLFYLLQNPNGDAATVTVTLPAAGAGAPPIVQHLRRGRRHSRFNDLGRHRERRSSASHGCLGA